MTHEDYDQVPGWPAPDAGVVRKDMSILFDDPAYQKARRARLVRRMNGWYQQGSNRKSGVPK